ncbi:MAG: hypothetical protein ACRD6X_20210, partial [Pyrinomonadaceae bacterium]
MLKKFNAVLIVAIIGVAGVFAQDAQLRNVPAGQKLKLKGVIISKIDENTMIVRDATGVDTKVVLAPSTSIK